MSELLQRGQRAPLAVRKFALLLQVVDVWRPHVRRQRLLRVLLVLLLPLHFRISKHTRRIAVYVVRRGRRTRLGIHEICTERTLYPAK